MNASKENARRARNALEQLVVAYNTSKIEVVRRFLIAAEARLPTEQAYKRDKLRRRLQADGLSATRHGA